MDHIGIDVHKKVRQICILAEGGELLERRVPTQGRRFAEELGARPHARILLESATERDWVARCLEGLGHEVVVADPNFAPMYATRTRKVQTDRRDARALAEACLPARVSGMLCQTHRRRQSAGGPAESARMTPRGAGTTASAAPPSRSDQDAPAPDSRGAGPGLCPEWERARCARIFRMTAGSWTVAIRRRRDHRHHDAEQNLVEPSS